MILRQLGQRGEAEHWVELAVELTAGMGGRIFPREDPLIQIMS